MKYLDESDVLDTRIDATAPANRSVSGYGGSVATNRSLRLVGQDGRARWYRVYAMVYANNAVPFVRVGGEELLASRIF